MIEDLVSRIFTTRNAAQLAHWKAKGEGSYARHEALGSFYDDIISKLDEIVEMTQGYSGLIGEPSPRTPKYVAPDAIVSHLTEEAEWIEDNCEEIADGCRAVQNALDELAGIYLKTIYKLKILR